MTDCKLCPNSGTRSFSPDSPCISIFKLKIRRKIKGRKKKIIMEFSLKDFFLTHSLSQIPGRPGIKPNAVKEWDMIDQHEDNDDAIDKGWPLIMCDMD